MLYFAYGSNLSSKRLRQRVPSAVRVAVARLPGHALRFHKESRVDGSAKCDAWESGDPGDQVLGVVYEIQVGHKPGLDRVEGLGEGYEEKQVRVELEAGGGIEAFTYYATLIRRDLRPLDWYKRHVLVGARENGLPEAYIREIEAVSSIPDSDKLRHARELAIYR